jgi:hypothetical protein
MPETVNPRRSLQGANETGNFPGDWREPNDHRHGTKVRVPIFFDLSLLRRYAASVVVIDPRS